MTTYRDAGPKDVDDILQLAREMHAETSFKTLTFNDGKAALEIMECILSPYYFFCLAEQEGKVVGFIVGYLSQPLFSEDLVVYDHAWYVGKSVRNTFIGVRLLKNLVRWSKIQNARALFVTTGSKVNEARVGKLVESQGFTQLGGYFRRDFEDET